MANHLPFTDPRYFQGDLIAPFTGEMFCFPVEATMETPDDGVRRATIYSAGAIGPHRLIFRVNDRLELAEAERLAGAVNRASQAETGSAEIGTIARPVPWALLCEAQRFVAMPILEEFKHETPREVNQPAVPDHLLPFYTPRYTVSCGLRLVAYPCRHTADNWRLFVPVPASLDFAQVRDWERAILKDPAAVVGYRDWCEEREWLQRAEVMRT